ncbi:MAG: hypothetical protein B7C24_13965 [Bacteroidetes bacterium 4572_77]|nr:MAG: hypothetical protein B7C24_13965 [Bacteroidetes bacterium 4572_77]
MKTRNFGGSSLVHFKQWSRNSFAIFNSLSKTIKIGKLNVALSIITLTASQAIAQSETQNLGDKELELNEVEVTAQAEPLVFSQVGRMITTITKKEIEQAPVSNLAELLSFVQSVDIRQRGGFGIQADVSIRGGSFDQVLVLLNGIPISDPQTGHFNLNIPVDLSQVEKVEILKGSASRVFGPNAFSGAINIITKTAVDNSLDLRLNGGQKGLYGFGSSLNTKLKNWTTTVSYDQKGSDGYMHNTDFKSYNAYAQSALQLNKVKIDGQIGFMQKDFGANSFYSPKYPNQYESNQSRMASLGIHFGSKFRVSILPYYRQHRDNWQLLRSNPETYQNFHQTDVYGARVKGIFYSPLGKTTLGLSYNNEHLLSSSMGEEMAEPKDIPWSKDHQFKYQYQRTHAGFYMEQNKSFFEKWNVSLGFLSHWYEGMEKGLQIYPGMDLSYQHNRALKLHASVNNAMRLPTFTDLFYRGPSNIGNPKLKPETSLNLELGAQYQKEGYFFAATVFHRKSENLIDWIWQDSMWKTENFTQLHTNGIELSAQINPNKQWNIKWWKKLSAEYTYLDLQKEKSDIKSKYALNNLRHQALISFTFEPINRLFLDVRGSYKDRLGGYLGYDFDTKKYTEHAYTDYFMLHAKISYSAKDFLFYVEASNLTDIQTVEYGVAQAGFWLMSGIKYHLSIK